MVKKQLKQRLSLSQRKTQIGVRLNDEEMEKLAKIAEARHTDVSEVVRQMIHREFAVLQGQAA